MITKKQSVQRYSLTHTPVTDDPLTVEILAVQDTALGKLNFDAEGTCVTLKL